LPNEESSLAAVARAKRVLRAGLSGGLVARTAAKFLVMTGLYTQISGSSRRYE